MDFLYNKKLAIIFSAALTIFSVFVLGGNSLKKEAAKVEDVFYGKNEYNINVEYECLEIEGFANNLLVIAKRHMDGNDSLITAVSAAGESIIDNTSAKNLVTFANEVHIPLYDLLSKLEQIGISGKDGEYIVSIRADLNTCYKKIGLTGFNDYAVKFNEMKSGLYAGLIAGTRGIKDMPVFVY